MKAALLMGAAAAVLSTGQAAAQQPAEGGAALEEIIVTGSRIARTNLNAATPVAVVDAQAIAFQAATNAFEVITQLPTAVGSLSTTNSNFTVNAAGLNMVSLRNLGRARTLVLVNGRRHVGGAEGESAVDMNSIPSEFIERIEVITGGASAVYGSEAMAGVVNVILKKNFEGIAGNVQYGVSSRGDGREYYATTTAGGNFADGRGNAMFNLTYDKQEEIASKDRDLSETDLSRSSSTGAVTRGPAAYSPYGAYGQFFLRPTATGASRTLVNGQVVPFSVTDHGYDRNKDRLIQVPTERYLFSGTVNYEIIPEVNWFLEGTYARTDVSRQLEPTAFGSNTTLGTQPGSPILTMPVTNPFVPAALRAEAQALGSTRITFNRRYVEGGFRGGDLNRNTFRFVTGFNGEVADWNYEAYYQYGETRYSQTDNGVFNVQNMQNALNAELGPNGQPRCIDATARQLGCVPINLFGLNSITPEALAYVTTNSVYTSDQSQHVAAFNISRSLFELPAGDLGFAAGVEYREEASLFVPDALSASGLSSGNASARVEGGFDVTEFYGETIVPILADQPFAKYIGLEGAVRYTDYSTIGGVWSWKIGGEWAPLDDIRFRSIYAKAIRAPNIGELFTAPRQTFSQIVDTCNGVTATSSRAQDALCRQDPGIAAAIAANGTFSVTNAQQSSVPGFNSGNPNLIEESAKTLTVGAVVTPTFLDNFSLSVDYYQIKIDDGISGFARNTSIRECYLTGNPVYCNTFQRAGAGAPVPGQIILSNQQSLNLAEITTSGIDVQLDYAHDLEDLGLAGSLSFNLIGTWLLKYESVAFPGAATTNDAGEIGTQRLRFNTRTTYDIGPFTATWRLRYLGPGNIDNPLTFEGNRLAAEVYNDLQFRYEVTEELELYAGVNNVMDASPPLIGSPLPGSNTGVETSAAVYDVTGRFFYMGMNVKF